MLYCVPSVVNDRRPPLGLPFLAMRMLSRIGLRRSEPAREGGAGGCGKRCSCSGGAGGKAFRSFTDNGEWERKDSAVSQTKCRSCDVAVNFRARWGVRIKMERLKCTVPVGREPLGMGLSSLTSSTDLMITDAVVSYDIHQQEMNETYVFDLTCRP